MPVRILKYEPDYEVIPQAIIWRPLRYFTTKVREGRDELDGFEGASFEIGNNIRFDLRTYRGHPRLTVTLYLADEIEDETLITSIIDKVIQEMVIPVSAVAWRRGQPFEYGKLERPKADRLHEAEARILALKIAAQQPNRRASTSFLKKEVPKYIELSSKDRTPSKTRRREQLWQQIVGNVIVHKALFSAGYAKQVPGGLMVTPKGLAYLNSIGFSEFPTSISGE